MIPLVLLPGLACDGALWAAQAADLADVAAPVIGDTLHDVSLPAMAARVLAAAPERFALCGLSMGGYLALEIMRQAPGRVARLALCDTSARPDSAEQSANRRTMIAAIDSAPFAELARRSTQMLIRPEAPEAVREAIVAMAVRVGPDVYRQQQEAIIARSGSRSLLPSIAVPTLVLVGADDRLTPPALAQEIAKAVPGARLAVVEGAAHLPPLEQPAATSAALRRWLVG